MLTLYKSSVYIRPTPIKLYFIVQRDLAVTYIEYAKWPCKVSCMHVNFRAHWAHTFPDLPYFPKLKIK